VLPLLGGDEVGSLLVGTNTGGVWLVRLETPDRPGSAEPFSNGWDHPNISCLIQGPNGPEHFYACAGWEGENGHVYETNPLHDATMRVWRRITPNALGGIVAMALVPGTTARIVLATGMGVFWANIPKLSDAYSWHSVAQLVDGSAFPTGAYSGLAVADGRV